MIEINIPRKHMSVAESTKEFIGNVGRERYYILDAGAGVKANKRGVLRATYVSLDITADYNVSVVGDIHHLPFKDCVFDAVISTQVFEHLVDPFHACRELHRVIRLGGEIFVTVPLVWKEHGKPSDFWRFTRHGCHQLLNQAEFKDIGIILEPFILETMDY